MRVQEAVMAQPALVDVLIIEDEEQVAELLAEVLGEADYRVAIAADGVRGLEAISRSHPRLVLCDVMLPRLSDVEVLHQIRANPSAAAPAVIMMSAAAPPALPPDVPFLAKPFDLEDLLSLVDDRLQSDSPL
jgi:CheY-like chemotaxis protein